MVWCARHLLLSLSLLLSCPYPLVLVPFALCGCSMETHRCWGLIPTSCRHIRCCDPTNRALISAHADGASSVAGAGAIFWWACMRRGCSSRMDGCWFCCVAWKRRLQRNASCQSALWSARVVEVVERNSRAYFRYTTLTRHKPSEEHVGDG